VKGMPTEVDFIPKQFVITSETEPAGFEGLIWYNPTTKLWKLYTNNEWKILIPFYVGDSAPSEAVDGMLWYDTLNDVTKVYDEASGTWNRLGVDWADITNKPALEYQSNKGVANGYCGLDADALVKLANIPIMDWSKLQFFNVRQDILAKFSNPKLLIATSSMLQLLNSAEKVVAGSISATTKELTIIGGSSTATGRSFVGWNLPSKASKVYISGFHNSINATHTIFDLLDAPYNVARGGSSDYNYHVLTHIGATASDLQLRKTVGGTTTTLATEGVDLAYDTWYSIEFYVDVINEVKVWRDGVLKFNIAPDTANIPEIESVAIRTEDTSTTVAQTGKYKGQVVIIYE